jgi:hypothetical protein
MLHYSLQICLGSIQQLYDPLRVRNISDILEKFIFILFGIFDVLGRSCTQMYTRK